MSDMFLRGHRIQPQRQQQQLPQFPQICSCYGTAHTAGVANKQQAVKRHGSPLDFADPPLPPHQPPLPPQTRGRPQQQHHQHQQLLTQPPRANRFESMPPEIQFHILASPGVLNADDLGRLALTSHGFLNLVTNFVGTVYAKRMLSPPVPAIEALVESTLAERAALLSEFSSAGRLLKRLSCLRPVPERVHQLAACMSNVCRAASKKPHLYAAAGAAAVALQSGWPDKWLDRALVPLLDIFPEMPYIGRAPSRLRITMRSVGEGTGQETVQKECLVRQFCRLFLLAGLSESQRANRLAKLVADWPDWLISRLLFALYGPLFDGRPMWMDMTRSTAANARQICACFGELGAALTALGEALQMRARLISIAEALLEFPANWLSENTASLMHTAGPKFASSLLISKARRGRVKELVMLLTSFCLVSVKVETPIDAVVSLIVDTHAALEAPRDRLRLLSDFSDSFRSVIYDLYENDGIGDRLDDFATLLDAQSELTRALLLRLTREPQDNREE